MEKAINADIRRLTVKDRDELKEVLNLSFKGDKDCGYFEHILPQMWLDDKSYMPKHFAAFENGKMVAALGVYTYKITIGNEELLFATVGNVATLPNARGKGHMQRLLNAAMDELDRLSVDVSRLGGLRSRYERFGYEPCGALYRAEFTKRNGEGYIEKSKKYSFKKVEANNSEAISFIRGIHDKFDMYAEREDDSYFYAVMCSWEYIPYIAYRDNEPIGYLCVSPNGAKIAESGTVFENQKERFDMLMAWTLQCEAQGVYAFFAPYEAEFGRLVCGICESVSMSVASQFKIINWDRLTGALLKLKQKYYPLMNGDITVDIKGRGKMNISVSDGCVSCEKTTLPADISLDDLTAARFLFGPTSPELCAELPKDSHKAALMRAWFPLPLSWNELDRV